MIDDGGAGLTRATYEIHHSRWQLRLLQQLGELERRHRSRLGGFEHHRVSNRESGRNLPRQHEQREVPWDYLADYS